MLNIKLPDFWAGLILVLSVVIIFFCYLDRYPLLGGVTIADTSQAPIKLVVKRGFRKKNIYRAEMEYVCVNSEVRPMPEIRFSKFFRSRDELQASSYFGCRVQIKKKEGRFFGDFFTVEGWYGPNARSEAGDQAKRIADAYHLPMGTCN